MTSTTALNPEAAAASDMSSIAVKDAPLLSTELVGEASSNTPPASETIATEEKSTIPTTELTSSISPGYNTAHLPVPSRAPEVSPSAAEDIPQRQYPDPPITLEPSQPIPIPIDEAGTFPAPPTRAKSLSITLLLISGVRYPFTINSEYMSRHNVQVTDQDPMQMGVFTLKECIWKEWKDEEWNVKPPSANFIRLIHFGRLLDDRQQLKGTYSSAQWVSMMYLTKHWVRLSTEFGYAKRGTYDSQTNRFGGR